MSDQPTIEQIKVEGINEFLWNDIESELEALSEGLRRDWKTQAGEPEPGHKWTKEEVERLLNEHGTSLENLSDNPFQ